MYACKEEYPGASQQNISNYFSLLWGKPISWRCVGDILSEKDVSIYRHPIFSANIGGEEIVALFRGFILLFTSIQAKGFSISLSEKVLPL
jgi:hypothetical protein